ncbi:hypothetical protein BL241_24190 [Ralstonia solanacearum]|uniref:Imm33-like domain-containing protein n=1 Tax=Ralstonia solanacearum TaxID=305 RepID=A0A0S4UGL3_RALSL|nr:hypothetical protein BL241_24190 [Ralstonia solanacearum]CUV21330.1 conserved protein of unknown function [Ralstonia solanacearum]
MFEYRANLRQRYNHPNIVVAVSPDLGERFDWILSYFEEAVAGGVSFHENQLVQVGWMMVMLRPYEQGDLEVWEPRLDSMPINWTRGATSTIRHLLLQREICAQLGVEPVFPTLRQSGVVSEHFFDSQEFCMERDVPQNETDSGWIFKDTNPEGGRHCSLFEIVVSRSEVLPFLALPAGVLVTYGKSVVNVTYGERSISSASNVFLARLVK